MALADDVNALRARCLVDLDAVHDHYIHTRRLWRYFLREVPRGLKLTVHNPRTGRRVNQDQLSDLAPNYISDNLASATFQQFLVHFEGFLFDLLRLWLRAYPRSLSNKTVRFGDVLDLGGHDAVVEAVIEHELNEVQYKTVADWFAYLERLVPGTAPSPEEVWALAEMKAARDLLVHNRGVANARYVRKAGPKARFNDGDRVTVPEPYLHDCWAMTKRIADQLCHAVSAKASS